MPSCNLSETVHNKWLQQSGNRGSDLYVATVDDFVRAVGDQYSTKRRKYGNTDPFSVFLSTLMRTIGVMRIN